MTVAEMFESAGLKACGPVAWRTPVPAVRPGVYVVARTHDASARRHRSEDVSHLPALLRNRWLPDELVLYIGCTVQPIQKRVAAFYDQCYGKKGPHAGGQQLLMLRYSCPLWVYWSETNSEDPKRVESVMIQVFKARTGGRRPFANGRD
ncbi:MAG: hypothetical protein WAU56_18235 [Steroidobacteraceae bacterium]